MGKVHPILSDIQSVGNYWNQFVDVYDSIAQVAGS
jgi:hypothetical protein